MIEHRVAELGEKPALVDDRGVLSYRELNARANALARSLIDRGFRRGAHGVVAMEHSRGLAITLLAVLKAGGAYSWNDGGEAMRLTTDGLAPIELAPLLEGAPPASPNLPILTRGRDIACVLPDEQGRLSVTVPHESIVTLCPSNASPSADVRWAFDASAFDLWVALMAGSTVSIPLTLPRAA